jgi:hypothetical protein
MKIVQELFNEQDRDFFEINRLNYPEKLKRKHCKRLRAIQNTERLSVRIPKI